MLTALSACGGGSGGGSNNTTPAPDCDPNAETCEKLVEMPPVVLVVACTVNPITHNCHTGMAHALDAADHIILPDYVATDDASDAPGDFTTWEGTGGALEPHETDEYKNDGGGADQIGAAYAYARGYDGTGITVSIIGYPTTSDHRELMGKMVAGYQANGVDDAARTATGAGTCTACSSNTATYHSHNVAGIIAALKNGLSPAREGRQGIAYGAQIKPIDITTDNIFVAADEAKSMALKRAIEEAASGTGITAMQYTAPIEERTTYIHPDDSKTYTYVAPKAISAIGDDEKTAWETASLTTVVVIAQGDEGRNSVNGQVDETYRSGEDGEDSFVFERNVAWSVVSAGDDDDANDNINLGSTHGRLPKEVEALQGKWLTVIALDPDNVIHEYSNGCGDAMAWCLGAPGVGIEVITRTDGSYSNYTNTHIAAAHVTGAIAVVASSLPPVKNTDKARAKRVEDLVSIILTTADDIGEPGVDVVYGHGALNLARATQPIGEMTMMASGTQRLGEARIDNSGITLPTSFRESLGGFTAGFTDDYDRAFIGSPTRITRENAAFTLGDTIATWDSPELQSITLDSNSKMQFTNYDTDSGAKDTLIFTHNLPNHTVGFSYNEESKTPDLRLTETSEELHFQKIRPIASDLMQLNATHKLGKSLTVKNAITSGEFDTGKRFNEAMANLSYAGENRNLTIGAGTLQEYGQFLGASGTGAYQLSDTTQSTITHLAISQNLPLNSSVKVKYTNFKTEVDMRYNNFAKINDLTANEYQLSLTSKQVFGKNDSLNLELIQPFAVTDGTLQQNTVLGYNDAGDYNNVTQNYDLKPANRRQQIRMTWQNLLSLKNKTKLFISMQYEKHVNNLRDNEDSQILSGISTRF